MKRSRLLVVVGAFGLLWMVSGCSKPVTKETVPPKGAQAMSVGKAASPGGGGAPQQGAPQGAQPSSE